MRPALRYLRRARNAEDEHHTPTEREGGDRLGHTGLATLTVVGVVEDTWLSPEAHHGFWSSDGSGVLHEWMSEPPLKYWL